MNTFDRVKIEYDKLETDFLIEMLPGFDEMARGMPQDFVINMMDKKEAVQELLRERQYVHKTD